jgi:DnaJ family protein A protein 5
MRKENERLNLDNSSDGESSIPVSELNGLGHNREQTAKDGQAASSDRDQNEASKDHNHNEVKTEAISQGQPEVQAESPSDVSDLDDEYASRRDVGSRLVSSLSTKVALDDPNDSTAATSLASDGDGSPKLGKAKLKRAKKKARQEKEVQENQGVSCPYLVSSNCSYSAVQMCCLYGVVYLQE